MYVYQCLNGGMTYSNHINIHTREHESDIMMSCHCSNRFATWPRAPGLMASSPVYATWCRKHPAMWAEEGCPAFVQKHSLAGKSCHESTASQSVL